VQIVLFSLNLIIIAGSSIGT